MGDFRNKIPRMEHDARIMEGMRRQLAEDRAWKAAHPLPRCACGFTWHHRRLWAWPWRRGTIFFCPGCFPLSLLPDREPDDIDPPYGYPSIMCNLYGQIKGQKAILEITRAMQDRTGNLPPLPAIFPDKMAPIVRGAGVDRELLMARWGFAPPNIPGQKARSAVLTNVRKTDSRFWLPYLKKVEHRCLVPATSFAEPDNNQGPRSIWTWFARDETRPLMFFAGIWREWEGTRGTKANPETGTHLLFSFLTTDASQDVAPVHSDATPVLLLDEEARERWMNAPWEEARDLQAPPPPGSLRIVATDTKQDG